MAASNTRVDVGARVPARAGTITDRVGTAAPGCPAERGSAMLVVVKSSHQKGSNNACRASARPDSRGRLSPRGPWRLPARAGTLAPTLSILGCLLIGHLRDGTRS